MIAALIYTAMLFVFGCTTLPIVSHLARRRDARR
jgi:hypothetical protein